MRQTAFLRTLFLSLAPIAVLLPLLLSPAALTIPVLDTPDTDRGLMSIALDRNFSSNLCFIRKITFTK